LVLRQERTGVDKQFFELCSKVVEAEGLKVYDMDYLHGSHELRLFIFDPETNSAVLEDCMKVDRALSPFIEEEEWMPAELTLEVSSPGVYRNLTTIEHFKNVEGEPVQLLLKKKLDEELLEGLSRKLKGQKKFVVQLVEVTDDSLNIELENKNINIKFDEIKKANLEIEIA
jgi:ribosome maturation factor RimP